ncbi:MAG: hypothetical protein HY422_03400, partial [Candidatus Komeilibacteria bacterium]|nr:hypothetical protein [Candidatus Komeilibacteria bacterium]
TAGWYTSLALDTDGLPVVSYQDIGGTRVLKVAKCGNADCSSGNKVTVVAGKRWCNGNTEVQCVSDASCAGFGGICMGDSTIQGEYSSIAIPADNLPVVSFRGGPSTGWLGVVKCSLHDCSDAVGSGSNTITTIGAVQSVGSWTSIAIAPDNGYPVIIHQDATDFDLEFVKCGNAACSSGNQQTTIFSSGSLGTHGSIAIGNDGYPVMSFYAGDAYPAYPAFDRFNLAFFKCNDALCSNAPVCSSGAVLRIGNTYLTKNNLKGLLCKAGLGPC